jgi:hypothetical protein
LHNPYHARRKFLNLLNRRVLLRTQNFLANSQALPPRFPEKRVAVSKRNTLSARLSIDAPARRLRLGLQRREAGKRTGTEFAFPYRLRLRKPCAGLFESRSRSWVNQTSPERI